MTARLLGAIAPVLGLWHAHPTNDHAAKLEDAYLTIVSGALDRLRASTATLVRVSQRRPRLT